jgi:hypothetical protein
VSESRWRHTSIYYYTHHFSHCFFTKYLKADLRGNELKMEPRWSRTVYKVKSLKGTTGASVPHYRVEAVSGDKDDETLWSRTTACSASSSRMSRSHFFTSCRASGG